ncbi:MAG TPA: hypothetical protein VIK45_15560 [Candidatus Dormibacteraeota bacterium]
MDRPEFDGVAVGDLVYVHDPMPPGHDLLLGDVVRKYSDPRVLTVYLPRLDRTMFAEPDRLHGYPLGEEQERACAWCRLHSLVGGGRPEISPPPARGGRAF